MERGGRGGQHTVAGRGGKDGNDRSAHQSLTNNLVLFRAQAELSITLPVTTGMSIFFSFNNYFTFDHSTIFDNLNWLKPL